MKKTKRLLPIYLFTAGLTAFAKSGVESVQLDYVALDASVGCNRILFQSSQHFKNTVFSIPRVIPGTGIETGRTYNITPTSKPGIYDLAISLYFPANDEDVKTGLASTYKKDPYACNWDKVKYDLNKNIKDPDLQIQRVTPIPLTSIEMRIPGLNAVGLIGRNVETNEEADILDYNGKYLTAHFAINENEKTLFQSQLVSAEGISTSVKFRFQARSRNGSVRAKIDSGNLAMNFAANATAKGFKFLGSADLSAVLKSSITENSVQITTESGTSEDVSKITNMLVDKILKEVGLALNQIQITEADRVKAGEGQIAVTAVVEVLKTKMSSEINFNMVSAPESATAQTEVKLKADMLNDPNSIEVKISAGYIDPSLGINLKAGETIAITPAYWSIDVVRFIEKREYLTASDIQTLKLGNTFEDLSNENMAVQNIVINGVPIAQGQWKPFSGRSPIAAPYKYRWVRIRRISERVRKESNVIPPKFEALKALPVFLTFSALGSSRFVQLAELLEVPDNPFWKALYEPQTGRVFLTAKKDLGMLRVRERFRDKGDLVYDPNPVILDELLQQRTNVFGNSEYTERHTLKDDAHAIVQQKTVGLFITRPRIMKASEFKHIEQAIQFLQMVKP